MTPVITTFDWVPDFARGFVRDVRARWACEEVGLPYRTHLIDFDEAKSPDHRAGQPFGQVPTWDDGEVAIFESGAIVLHIARTLPGLLPGNRAARARAEQWAIAALNSVEPTIFDLMQCDLFEADKPWSAQRRPAVVDRLHARLQGVANALGDAPWLDGDAFTAGDLTMVSALRQIGDASLLAEHAKLAEYVARGEARPAFVQAMADHLAAFEPADRMRAAQTQEQAA
ncbi:glutathione S-transferase family protein [Sphingomonas sp.]|uniref:glutathione S-transferase family protein n=1 Tax=Sphingomonas sp. TaxID=28214 RepID=UPI0035BC8E93